MYQFINASRLLRRCVGLRQNQNQIHVKYPYGRKCFCFFLCFKGLLMFRIPRNLCPKQNHHVPRGSMKRGEFLVISGIFVFQAAASKIYRKHIIVSGMSSSFFSHNHYCELKFSQKTRYPYYSMWRHVLFVSMLNCGQTSLLVDIKSYAQH